MLRGLNHPLWAAGTAVCGLLLYASFPPIQCQAAAWFALVPLMVACARLPVEVCFRLGMIAGLAFWLPSISWLIHVSAGGWIALAAYCALYTAAFAAATSWLIQRSRVGGRFGQPAVMLGVPTLWTGFEFLRSILFTGFPWNQLGVSQYRNLAIIQVAEWGGVYAVSWLVAFVNTALALALLRVAAGRSLPRRGPSPELAACLAVLGATFLFGRARAGRFLEPTPNTTLALVQPNIPQVEKWSDEHADQVRERVASATRAAIAHPAVDMVVWPETAVPDFVMHSPLSYGIVAELLTNGAPILVGSMDVKLEARRERYYNSSFFFLPGANQIASYAKRHLVIFGEYVPFERFLPFLRALTPIEGSFEAGTEDTVFDLPGTPERRFSVLICFEDVFPGLARRSVRAGAKLLVNQTNDAWFDPSAASLQHMSHCVFRCVENRVPAVRAANTGVSCAIEPSGRITSDLGPSHGRSLQPEFLVVRVHVPNPDMALTFYSRHGDLLAITCLAFLAALALEAALKRLGFRLKAQPILKPEP